MDPALRLDGVGIEKGWSRNGVGLESEGVGGVGY